MATIHVCDRIGCTNQMNYSHYMITHARYPKVLEICNSCMFELFGVLDESP